MTLLAASSSAATNAAATDDEVALPVLVNHFWLGHGRFQWMERQLCVVTVLYFTIMTYDWHFLNAAGWTTYAIFVLVLVVLPFARHTLQHQEVEALKAREAAVVEATKNPPPDDGADSYDDDDIDGDDARGFRKKRSWRDLRDSVRRVLEPCGRHMYKLVNHAPIKTAALAAAFLVPVLIVDCLVGRRNAVTGYFVFVCMFRAVNVRTVGDIVALLFVYGINVDVIDTVADRIWVASTRLVILAFLVMCALSSIVIRRTHFRMWEHIRLLIILRRKTRRDRALARSIAAAALLPEVLARRPSLSALAEGVWPSMVGQSADGLVTPSSPPPSSPPPASVAEEASEGEGKDEAKVVDVERGVAAFTKRITGQRPTKAVGDSRGRPTKPAASVVGQDAEPVDALVAAARAKGLLLGPDPAPTLPHADVRTLDTGLRREHVTVVAIKIVGQNPEHECALNNHGVDVVHELLDALSARHKVVRCRRMGDLWIGSVGFFDNWGSDRDNSFHALQFAGEAMWFSTKLRLRMCCAVESGAVDGGVLVGSPYFDMFGSDVRWVLRMVEARQVRSLATVHSVAPTITRARRPTHHTLRAHSMGTCSWVKPCAACTGAIGRAQAATAQAARSGSNACRCTLRGRAPSMTRCRRPRALALTPYAHSIRPHI